MFSDIKVNSASRITEIKDYIDFLDPLIPSPPVTTPIHLNCAKGLVYVQLYGVIEQTVRATISRCITLINDSSININDLKPILLSLALSPELDSLYGISRNKWDKRHVLFKKIETNQAVNILTDLLPTDGKNIHHPQLESIWRIFCITEPLFHDMSFHGRLQDIVSNRVNIAHGNLAASEIGARVTIPDLNIRLQDVSTFCTYFISVFEDYISQSKFRI